MEKNKITAGTIARTVVLVIALINQVLTMAGINPLPWSDDEVYTGITAVLTVAASIAAWWKNNSLTAPAREADRMLNAIKSEKPPTGMAK